MISKVNSSIIGINQFWALLNDYDKYQYNCIRLTLSNQSTKNMRNKRIESFKEAIDMIHRFSVRSQPDDNLRCLVCGIAWLPEGLAINTHQLKFMISKCKSSINGSLQKMGFTVDISRVDSTNAIVSYFPFLKDNHVELRKWSIRKYPEGFQPIPIQKITPVINPNPTELIDLDVKNKPLITKPEVQNSISDFEITFDDPIQNSLIDSWDVSSLSIDSWL